MHTSFGHDKKAAQGLVVENLVDLRLKVIVNLMIIEIAFAYSTPDCAGVAWRSFFAKAHFRWIDYSCLYLVGFCIMLVVEAADYYVFDSSVYVFETGSSF